MEIDVHCEGIDSLLRRLERAGADVDRIFDVAIEKGAKQLQASIKPVVPVDEGTLRNSISVEKIEHLAYAVGTNLDYAVYVEFGTGRLGDQAVPHTEKSSWVYFDDKLGHFVTTHGQEPAHFMHDGFYAGKDDAVEAVRKELLKWLT